MCGSSLYFCSLWLMIKCLFLFIKPLQYFTLSLPVLFEEFFSLIQSVFWIGWLSMKGLISARSMDGQSPWRIDRYAFKSSFLLILFWLYHFTLLCLFFASYSSLYRFSNTVLLFSLYKFPPIFSNMFWCLSCHSQQFLYTWPSMFGPSLNVLYGFYFKNKISQP